VPHSWWSRRALAGGMVVASALAQGPGFRVVYSVRVFARTGGAARVVATGAVSGPEATALRLSVRTDTAVVDGLVDVESDEDTVTLAGAFVTERRVGRSRRGLPVWEEDAYRRIVLVPWGQAVRLYPFGPDSNAAACIWIALQVTRAFVGGETPPEETYETADSSLAIDVEAVLPPRRARLRMKLVRGDSSSAPEVLDLAVEGSSTRVTFVLGRRVTQALDVRLSRPAPPPTLRDTALAVDADVVCARVTDPLLPEPAWTVCGRLNTVARRVALSDHDTLVVAFAWPAAR
jgi:hypothetical protein